MPAQGGARMTIFFLLLLVDIKCATKCNFKMRFNSRILIILLAGFIYAPTIAATGWKEMCTRGEFENCLFFGSLRFFCARLRLQCSTNRYSDRHARGSTRRWNRYRHFCVRFRSLPSVLYVCVGAFWHFLA